MTMPPLRNCPVCGRRHRAWSSLTVCSRCKRDPDVNRDDVHNGGGFADIAREQRLARRGVAPSDQES